MVERDPVSGAMVPAPMRPFVDALGLDDAVRLSSVVGFSRINVPLDPGPDNQLVRLAGLETARRLSGMMAGERVYVPFCRRFMIHYHRARGLEIPEIARRLKCSEQYVYKTLRAGRQSAMGASD